MAFFITTQRVDVFQTSIFNLYFTTPNIGYFICKHAGFRHIFFQHTRHLEGRGVNMGSIEFVFTLPTKISRPPMQTY